MSWGCIVKSYIVEEALEVYVKYLSDCDAIRVPSSCLIDILIERLLRGTNIKVVDDPLLAQVHQGVLMSTP